MKQEFRAVIHFLYLRGESNKDIHTQINDVYGESSIGIRTVQKWTKLFKEGKNDLNDEPRSGRPKRKDLHEQISSILSESPDLSCKKIREKLQASQMTVKKIILELGYVKVNFRWIPYRLNEVQKQKRVMISKELLIDLKKTKKSNIITQDETWLYFQNPISSIWLKSGVPRPTIPKKNISSKKILVSVFWSVSGILSITGLPKEEKFTSLYFSCFFFEI